MIELFTQNTHLTGCAAIHPPELAAEVVDRVESASVADLLKRAGALAQQSSGDLEPVAYQRLHGRARHECLETASRLTAAHMRGSGDIPQRYGVGIALMNKSKHLVQANIRVELHAVRLATRQRIEVSVNELQHGAELALHRHLVAGLLLLHPAVNALHQAVHLPLPAAAPEYDIGQRITARNGVDVVLVDGRALRRHQSARKDNIRHGVCHLTARLAYAMQHICIEENTLPGLQGDVLQTDLKHQRLAQSAGYLKVRVPVQRAGKAGQSAQLITEKSDGKNSVVVRNVLAQLVIQYHEQCSATPEQLPRAHLGCTPFHPLCRAF